MIDWIAFSDRKPELGQKCLISFSANPSRLQVCYFDNLETFEKREQSLGFELADNFDTWFTSHDDDSCWWEPRFIGHWTPVQDPDRA